MKEKQSLQASRSKDLKNIDQLSQCWAQCVTFSHVNKFICPEIGKKISGTLKGNGICNNFFKNKKRNFLFLLFLGGGET